MVVELLAGLVTLALGGLLGYGLSARISVPRHVWGLFLWAVAVIVAEHIGRSVMLLSVFGFAIYLNTFLMSLVLGTFVGMLVTRR